ESNPSIANPDHTWWYVVGDMRLCPKLSPLVVNLDPITTGQLSRFSVDCRYPKLRRRVVFCQRWQRLPLVVEGMESASVFVRSSAPCRPCAPLAVAAQVCPPATSRKTPVCRAAAVPSKCGHPMGASACVFPVDSSSFHRTRRHALD